MLTIKETFVYPIAAVDPSGGANDVDPTVTPSSLTPCHDGVFHDYSGNPWTASR